MFSTLVYGICLTLGTDKHEFYHSSSEEIDRWVDCLSLFCIMTKIGNFYKWGPQIGEGSFANVHRWQHRVSKIKYAGKTIPKIKLFNEE